MHNKVRQFRRLDRHLMGTAHGAAEQPSPASNIRKGHHRPEGKGGRSAEQVFLQCTKTRLLPKEQDAFHGKETEEAVATGKKRRVTGGTIPLHRQTKATSNMEHCGPLGRER